MTIPRLEAPSFEERHPVPRGLFLWLTFGTMGPALFSRHLDVRTLLVYDDNREDLGGKMARLVAEEL